MTGLYVASNPTALSAQFNLTSNMGALSDTLTRLSTGLRINSGKDDPAGLIASSLLKAEITGTTKAISNTQRANSMIATADSAMGQVSNLLNDIKGLVVEAANEGAMSADAIRANQLQVDASINSIDRIATTTTYGGKKLLDGSMGFSTSGVDKGSVSNLDIKQANFGTSSAIGIDVQVQELARKGTLVYNGTGVDQKTTLDITGSTGTKSFTFGAGTTNAQMAEAINAASDSTGVTAFVEGAAARGTIELNGVGANNGLVITANEEGFDAGNYTFRIVKGETNDAYVVSDPTTDKPGVIEVSLQESYGSTYNKFAGMFDISIDTGTESAATSVSITRGTVNQAYLAKGDTNANAKSADGQKTLTVTNAGGGSMSSLNGWTMQMVENGDDKAGTFDDNSKIAYVAIGTDDTTRDANTAAAVARISNGAAGAAAVMFTEGASSLAVGDTFKLGGGADKGELVVTYKEGATADDVLKLMNNVNGVQASLASGVSGSKLVSNIISGSSRESVAQSTASQYTSSATATDVMELINSKLGDKFTAALASNTTGTGKMTYMDAAVDYGSVNLDNAIRFTGMDNGPVVRLTAGKADQALGINLRNPSEAERKNGITTQVLEIQLATDASGNSITTAADIVNMFNSLTPDKTGGVSATLLLPDGVDPNGRTWVTDECGNVSELTDCNATYGKGIVDPTGVAGTCEIQENDLVLLGANQALVKDNAVAYVPNSAPNRVLDVVAGTGVADSIGVSGAVDTDTAFTTALGDTSWNPVTINFAALNDGDNSGEITAVWDGNNLNVSVDLADLSAVDADALLAAVNAAGADKGLGTLGLTVNDGTAATGDLNVAATVNFATTPATKHQTPSGLGQSAIVEAAAAGATNYGAKAQLALTTEEVGDTFWNNVNIVFTALEADGTTGATNAAATLEEVDGVMTLTVTVLDAGTSDTATIKGLIDTAVDDYNTDNGTSVGYIDFTDGTGATDATSKLFAADSTALADADAADEFVLPTNGMSITNVPTVTAPSQATGQMIDNSGNVIALTTTQTGLAAGDAANSSALNGVTIKFTTEGGGNTWDGKSGTLTVSLNSASTDANVTTAVNQAIASYEADILKYNGSNAATGTLGQTNGVMIAGFTASGTTGADLNGLTFTLNGGLSEGDVIEMRGSTGTVDIGGGSAKITTNKPTSALNGVSFNFTTDSAQAGFDENTGQLTVFLNPETQAISGAANLGTLQEEVNQAINGAINSNWEAIRGFTNSLDIAVPQVKLDLGAGTTVSDLLTLDQNSTDLRLPSSDSNAAVVAVSDAQRGVSVNDPALLIKANEKGTDMAGVQIHFVQDDLLDPSTTEKTNIRTTYVENKDGSKVLTIYANTNGLQNGTQGGIDAGLLAEALNKDTTFNKVFSAEAPINEIHADGTGTGVVSFGNGVLSKAETVGGYKVSSEDHANNATGQSYATSSGIGMTGNTDSNERLVLEATEFGSEHFVKVDVVSGSFDTYCPLGLAMNELAGTDVVATINGNAATGRGTNIEINTGDLALSMDVANKVGSTSFDITGGGALFQLGSNVVSSQQMRLGIPSIMSTKLGGTSGYLYQLKSGGDADLTKSNASRTLADAIVNDAISSVANTRGYLGAVQKSSLEPNISVLQDSLVALTEANGLIENADFAEESSNLTRLQLLVQAGMQTLGIANQFPQYAASLVR